MYGDPAYGTDFRDIYAYVLQNWFGMPKDVSDFVIGKDRLPIDGLVPTKNPPIGSEEFGALLGHKISDKNPDVLQIHFSLLQEGPVIIEVLDKSGQVLRPLINEFRNKGSHTLDVNTKNYVLRPGEYQYRMKVGGKIYQRPLLIN